MSVLLTIKCDHVGKYSDKHSLRHVMTIIMQIHEYKDIAAVNSDCCH